VPCLHNTGAHALGKESHDLFHVKDRAETWKAQYPDSLEYPMLSDFAIYERYVTHSLPPPLPHLNIQQFCFCLVTDLLGVDARRLLDGTQHKSTLKFLHPYAHTLTCTHAHTLTCTHVHTLTCTYILRYLPLLLRKPGRPKEMRRHMIGMEMAHAKKHSRAQPRCTTCSMLGRKANNKSWLPKT